MALQFVDPEVNEKYIAKTDVDVIKRFSGFHKCYKGKLSRIDLYDAAYMVHVKDPHIQEKPVAVVKEKVSK